MHRFVHIGGDEVNAACWGVDSAGAATLMGKYVSRLQPMVSALGKGMIQWQGAFDAGVRPAKDTVIQLWKPDSFRAILDAGYRMLLSPYTSWYLDCGGGNWISGGTSWCAPFKSWQVCCGCAHVCAARLVYGWLTGRPGRRWVGRMCGPTRWLHPPAPH